jgi:CDP-diacylglycerol--glycerol-3-phosphate 3-phosphatidyltransferase
MTISTARDENRPARSNLPTALTWARIAAGVVAAGLALLAYERVFVRGAEVSGALYLVAFGIFTLAALTDALDGVLARRLGAVSVFGAALDHAADKALTHAMLLVLAATVLPMDLIAAAGIVIARDAVVAGLREGLAPSGRAPGVGPLGKVKTVAIMVGCAASLLLQALALNGAELALLEPLSHLVRIALWAGAAAALVSALIYVRSALRPGDAAPPKGANKNK